jgi:hypothetical protein
MLLSVSGAILNEGRRECKSTVNCPNRPSQNEYRKRVFKCGVSPSSLHYAVAIRGDGTAKVLKTGPALHPGFFATLR